MMARADVLWPFVKSYEGGFSNHPHDKGGATNMGVTIAVWKAQGYDKDGDGDIDVDDLRLISEADARAIFKKNYWDRWKADQIVNQSLANMLVDWTWCSGKHGIVIPQRLLGVVADGIVGPKTLAALNAQLPAVFHARLKAEREAFLRRICVQTPTNAVFLNGWLSRLNAMRYGSLVLNTRPQKTVYF